MKRSNKKLIMQLAKEVKSSSTNVEKITMLINNVNDSQFDINTKIYRGRTLLHYAILGGNYFLIIPLIKAGINPNICDDDYNTPLHLAIIRNEIRSIKELLKTSNLDINASSEFEQTPLHKAVIKGNIEIIKLLINKGADPTLVDEKNQTPLDYAQDEGDLQIINYLSVAMQQEGELNG